MRTFRTLAFVLLSTALWHTSAAAQDAGSDSYWYGRVEYGMPDIQGTYGSLGLGFGRRIVRNPFAVDVLIFSGQRKLFGTYPDLHAYGGIYTHASVVSLMTVKVLHLLRPNGRTSAYLGGGAGWGTVDLGRRGAVVGPGSDIDEVWHGSGLQGAITIGYELARSGVSTRLFVQADFVSPFHKATRVSRTGVSTGERHISSLVISIGAGW